MPAWITEKGYIRVTWPGFDRTLTNWRGDRLKDFPQQEVQKLCDDFNRAILMGNFDAVKTWFPRERSKQLFSVVAYQWLERTARKKSTYKQYLRDLENHILPHMEKKSFLELTRQDFYWIDELWGNTWMAKRLRQRCQSIVTWVWREGITDKQIFVPSVRVPAKPTPYIELEDRWGIWKRMDARYQKPAMLNIEMGMRAGEVVALQWDSVNFKDGYLRIIRSLSDREVIPMRKAGDELWVPLDMPFNQKATAMLKEERAHRKSHWVFHGKKGNHLWSKDLSEAFKGAARAYGLPQAYLHACRHSFIQDRFSDGYSREEVQALVGIQSLKVLEKYKGLGIRHLRKLGRIAKGE